VVLKIGKEREAATMELMGAIVLVGSFLLVFVYKLVRAKMDTEVARDTIKMKRDRIQHGNATRSDDPNDDIARHEDVLVNVYLRKEASYVRLVPSSVVLDGAGNLMMVVSPPRLSSYVKTNSTIDNAVTSPAQMTSLLGVTLDSSDDDSGDDGSGSQSRTSKTKSKTKGSGGKKHKSK
jgi:hypothetical protein